MTEENQNSIPAEVIKRLKEEKKQSEERYFKKGYLEGKQESLKITYDELRQVVSNYEIHTEDAVSADLFDPRIVTYTSLWDENSWFSKLIDKHQDDDQAFDMDNYLRGFVKAVIEFWKAIKNELESNEDNE